MSLLNCHVQSDRVLVAVDTRVGSPDSRVESHASKLLTLPHANVVLAMRGELAIFNWMCVELNISVATDFDAMASAMGDLLCRIHGQRMEVFPDNPFAGLEILLAGWSTALGRMQAVRWQRWPGDKAFRVGPVSPWVMSPDPGYAESPAAPDNADRMAAVARDQVDLLRKFSGVVVGGRLLLAELTRDSLAIRTIADLEATA